ncbi:protein phosphatase CheZ [Rhodoferax sp. GW822-FHT02A01]|jgi:chemotaxis protein CheZ|uniref:protein phosphatase CheZ n=1 Tax=Rhodoferax sp. GW822-FHT02A01 TaxID=3141537 RepID=UPI00315C844D
MSTPLSKEEAFARLGAITREMHEALTVLGNNNLQNIVQEIPNARDRLAYVGKMTEDAANKVLTLVEKAKPECNDLQTRGIQLGESLTRLAANPNMNVDMARGLMVTCGKFAQSTSKFAEQQSEVLSDIMMAQDFQDLSGQVIQKVIDIITKTELQLVQLLVDSSPEQPAVPEETEPATVDTHVLHGPQTADKALQQTDVDDLLASLGF